MKIYGLTGGIGSGKTTVAKFLAELGVPVVDADEIARELREPGGAAADAILNVFGTLDRFQLRRLLSEDPENKRKLEAILHPLIREESSQRLQVFKSQGHELAIYEAALLIETGRYQDFDGIILVTSPIDDRIVRLAKRNNWNESQARQAIQLQMTDEEKYPFSQWIIRNDGTVDALSKKTSQVLDELRIAATFPFPLR